MNRNLLTKKLNSMKSILSVFTLAAVMTACNSNPKTGTENTASTGSVIMLKDTSGLAEFQAWKAYQADKNYSEFNSGVATAAVPARKYASAKPARSKSTSRPAIAKSESISSEGAYPAKAPAKKGWSKAAKGAAIGAGTGAVAGAVIHKRNRVVGGVVGGVVGAGVGYGIGRTIDKKDGRYFAGY